MGYYGARPLLFQPQNSDILIEGFEEDPSGGLPIAGLYTTLSNAGSSGSVDRTTSHVTQGTYSYRLQGAIAEVVYLDLEQFDLTPIIAVPTQVKIDVYVQTINVIDEVFFYASDSLGGFDLLTSTGTTGAFTLTLPFATVNDFTTIAISVGVTGPLGAPLTSAADVYFDNLRGS